jgi:Flp pilus assembly protein TadG
VDDRGSASVELVLLTPVVIILLLLVVAAGRMAVARNQIDEAARDAAREASLWRSPAVARDRGVAQALAELADGPVGCGNPVVAIDTTRLHPGGEVVADVACTVVLSDLVGLRMGPSRIMRATAVAVVDTYRSQ